MVFLLLFGDLFTAAAAAAGLDFGPGSSHEYRGGGGSGRGGQGGQHFLAGTFLLFLIFCRVLDLVLSPENVLVEIGFDGGRLDLGDPDLLELRDDVGGDALGLESRGGAFQDLIKRKIIY